MKSLIIDALVISPQFITPSENVRCIWHGTRNHKIMNTCLLLSATVTWTEMLLPDIAVRSVSRLIYVLVFAGSYLNPETGDPEFGFS